MSDTFVISDLHLGHDSIIKFEGARTQFKTIEEHDEWIISQWNSVVKKGDIVLVLGDVCFKKYKMPLLFRLNGQKKLIMGNHDKYNAGFYLGYFIDVKAIMKYKNFWLSHEPIHPESLRGLKNVHGHCHHLPDLGENYINVTVEALNGIPKKIEEL